MANPHRATRARDPTIHTGKEASHKGTVEFDWYKREIAVHLHHSPRSERIAWNAEGAGHFGGDRNLAYNFLQVMRGEAESLSPLEAGIVSALTCIKARESADTRQFREVVMPEPAAVQ